MNYFEKKIQNLKIDDLFHVERHFRYWNGLFKLLYQLVNRFLITMAKYLKYILTYYDQVLNIFVI